jgi:dienelactone hydrolase
MTQVAQMTSFQSGSRQLEGYMARPEGDGPFPGIVIIHEIYGLNDTIKNYNESAAQDSWRRVLAFFEEHLEAKAEV